MTAACTLVLLSCSGTQAEGDHGSERHARELATLLQTGVGYDYEPFTTPQAQRDASDVVVVGTIAEATTGRTLPYGRGSAQTNLAVKIDDVIAGEVDSDVIYVELSIQSEDGPADITEIDTGGRLLLFLEDRTDVRSPDGESGRPTGEKIYTPYVQGMIIEAGDGWVSGMVASDDWGRAWTEVDTFDGMVAALR